MQTSSMGSRTTDQELIRSVESSECLHSWHGGDLSLKKKADALVLLGRET